MGARVSEVASLYRGEEFLKFPDNGDLLLWPAPGFLAKNEDPQRRRDPVSIRCLPNSPLCPVATL